jgi:hypothetical protein
MDLEEAIRRRKKTQAEDHEIMKAIDAVDFGAGGRGGRGGRGSSDFTGILKSVTESQKYPKEEFERDFIMELDNTLLSESALKALTDKFTRKGVHLDRFSGMETPGMMKHLGDTIRKFRPEIYFEMKKRAGG